jgi:hypothetical protein
MDRSQFLRLVKERLPDLRQALNQQRQILGSEVQVLGRAAQRAIYDGDRGRLAICFAVADRAHSEGNTDLRSCMESIFVDELEFDTPHNSHPWAREMLSRPLLGHYTERRIAHGYEYPPTEPVAFAAAPDDRGHTHRTSDARDARRRPAGRVPRRRR